MQEPLFLLYIIYIEHDTYLKHGSSYMNKTNKLTSLHFHVTNKYVIVKYCFRIILIVFIGISLFLFVHNRIVSSKSVNPISIQSFLFHLIIFLYFNAQQLHKILSTYFVIKHRV